jgi:hypothetical protein
MSPACACGKPASPQHTYDYHSTATVTIHGKNVDVPRDPQGMLHCPVPSCKKNPFATTSGLKKHAQNYHSVMAASSNAQPSGNSNGLKRSMQKEDIQDHSAKRSKMRRDDSPHETIETQEGLVLSLHSLTTFSIAP